MVACGFLMPRGVMWSWSRVRLIFVHVLWSSAWHLACLLSEDMRYLWKCTAKQHASAFHPPSHSLLPDVQHFYPHHTNVTSRRSKHCHVLASIPRLPPCQTTYPPSRTVQQPVPSPQPAVRFGTACPAPDRNMLCLVARGGAARPPAVAPRAAAAGAERFGRRVVWRRQSGTPASDATTVAAPARQRAAPAPRCRGDAGGDAEPAQEGSDVEVEEDAAAKALAVRKGGRMPTHMHVCVRQRSRMHGGRSMACYMRTCVCACMPVCTHVCGHACMNACMRACVWACLHG
eukprot:350678-Chlamydomonas_euryale.AAC.2